MLTLRLQKDLEKRLEKLAKKTGRTKSFYAREAILEYLDEQEDYQIAIARLEKKRPAISIKEVERRLGLED